MVCGILFKPIETLLVPHFGVFWGRLKPEFSSCQEVAPLAPIVERFEDTPGPDIALSEIPLLPRIWFLHQNDVELIQLQRDRFLFNWRKRKPIDQYPRYPNVFDKFQAHFLNFQRFLSGENLGTVTPLQYELTYVNLILQGSGWNDISDIGNVFPDFAWRKRAERFLKQPEAASWRTSFALPNSGGRLHLHIQKALRRSDRHPLLRFELTARGMAIDMSHEAMREWFDIAHVSLVHSFADMPGEQVQEIIWRRKR